MPVWLIKLLPYGAAAIALALAVWYIDHRGYERAEAQNAAINAKLDQQAKDLNAQLERDTSDLEGKMALGMATINGNLVDQISSIETTNKTIIQPTLTKEIASDPRLSAPANALSAGVFDALNQARALSASSRAGGTGTASGSTVSHTQPAQ